MQGLPSLNPASCRYMLSLPLSPSQDGGKMQGKVGFYLWWHTGDLDSAAGPLSCWVRSLASLVSGTCLCPCLTPSDVTGPSGPWGLRVWDGFGCWPWSLCVTGPHRQTPGSQLHSLCQDWVPAPRSLVHSVRKSPHLCPNGDFNVLGPPLDSSMGSGPGGGWGSDSLLKDPGFLSTCVSSLPNLSPLTNTPHLPLVWRNLELRHTPSSAYGVEYDLKLRVAWLDSWWAL